MGPLIEGDESLIAHAKHINGKDKAGAEASAKKVIEELIKAKLIAVDAKGGVTYQA